MKKRPQSKWIFALFIIAIAIIGLSFLNLGQNIVYFYTPAEAQAKAAELSNQTIKVGAMVMPNTIVWKADELKLSFRMSDLQNHEIDVFHNGPAPDLFKEGQGVVAEGRLSSDGKSMQAQKLMVKHSEEYQKPDGTRVDREMLEKSMFKDQSGY